MVKVKGTLKTVTGQPLISSLSITLTDYGVNPPSTLYLPAKVVVVPDLNGQFEVDLWANQSSSHPCTYRVETPQGSSFLISIPGGVLGPLDIGALVVTKPDLREDTNILHRLAKLEATGGGGSGGTGVGEPLTFGNGLIGGTYNGSEPITVEVASTIARVNSPALVNPTSNHPAAGDNSTRVATTGWSSDAGNLTSGVLNPARLPTNLVATTAQRLATPRSIFGTPFDGTADIPQLTLGAGLNAPTATSINLDFNIVASVGDTRFTNSREWIAPTVTQTEAETGTDPLRRAWSAQRVRQAIVGWWASFEGTIARLNSPIFTGSPSAPTPPAGDSSTRLSTTAWSSNAAHLTQGTIPVARIPTLNQDTTGTATNATKLATPRNILGLPFDGTADLPINPGNGLVVDSGVLGINPLDSRMTDAREWTASTVTQTEAETGTGTTRRAWTAQRVRQAITAWWASVDLSLARVDSPNFTGAPSAPTPSAEDSSTRLATTAWASNASNLTLGTVPTARIPTLNQNTTGNATTATRLAIARTIMGVAFDGTVNIAPTLTSGLNYPATGSLGLDFTVVAPLASPAFTGTPTAPTPSAADSSTRLATTAWASNASNLTLGTIPAARVPVLNQATTANAGTATRLATARTIAITGATAAAVAFDGTANITLAVTGLDATLLTGTIADARLSANIPRLNTTIVGSLGLQVTGVPPLGTLSTVSQIVFFTTGGNSYSGQTNAGAPVGSRVVDWELGANGSYTLRRINDAYSAVTGTPLTVTSTNNLLLSGFTVLGTGNTGVKCKIISGTTPATEGANLTFAHGLVGGKIVHTSGTINFAANATVPIPGNQSSYASFMSTSDTLISMTLMPAASGGSGGILSKPFRIMIWYIE